MEARHWKNIRGGDQEGLAGLGLPWSVVAEAEDRPDGLDQLRINVSQVRLAGTTRQDFPTSNDFAPSDRGKFCPIRFSR